MYSASADGIATVCRRVDVQAAGKAWSSEASLLGYSLAVLLRTRLNWRRPSTMCRKRRRHHRRRPPRRIRLPTRRSSLSWSSSSCASSPARAPGVSAARPLPGSPDATTTSTAAMHERRWSWSCTIYRLCNIRPWASTIRPFRAYPCDDPAHFR